MGKTCKLLRGWINNKKFNVVDEGEKKENSISMVAKKR